MTRPRLCTFTKADGTPCRDLAAHRTPLCRHHGRQASRDHRRVLALHPGRTVRLGPIHTPAAALNALNRVIQLLAAGTLPPDRAGRAAWRIHQALAALRSRSAFRPTADGEKR